MLRRISLLVCAVAISINTALAYPPQQIEKEWSSGPWENGSVRLNGQRHSVETYNYGNGMKDYTVKNSQTGQVYRGTVYNGEGTLRDSYGNRLQVSR
jgi:hypothetical protein